MKYKIITIAALLVVMVALTGAASATQLSLLRDGKLLGEPILVKNNEHFNISLQVTFLRTQDLGTSNTIGVQNTGCTNETGALGVNCDITDVNLTKTKDSFIVTSIPTTTQDDSVRADINVPISRHPGTQYSYFITVFPFGNPPVPAQASRTVMIKGSFITGKKCNDLDGNGICGQGEPGLAGWTINLKDESGTIVATTQTDADGIYAFKGQQINILDPNTGAVIGTEFLGLRGTFTVEEALQAGWTQTGPQPVPPGTYVNVLVDANNVTGLDFANTQIGSISGQKWNDLNGDGIKDASEPRLAGWTIKLTNESGGVVTNVTDVNGNYSFTGLADGNYTVGEILQPGWSQTAPTTGTFRITISGGNEIKGLDFGNKRIPPKAFCLETVNPAGKKVPPAGSTTLPGSKGGQNEDGFYELQAKGFWSPFQIFVRDTGSGTIFPLSPPGFSPGTKIKYTQAPGATPSIKMIGGPNSAVDWHITGTGDAAVYAVDMFGDKGPEQLCKVPPPPK